MLDEKHGYDNFSQYVGYQPPFVTHQPGPARDGRGDPGAPDHAVIRESDFLRGNQLLGARAPEGQTLWQNAWAEFLAGV